MTETLKEIDPRKGFTYILGFEHNSNVVLIQNSNFFGTIAVI
jgi:hypothetical protein